MVRWEDFYFEIFRHFIINLYLYSSVIIPTILIKIHWVYKKWASLSLPFNQFCFFLSPRFGLFNLKTDINFVSLLKSENGWLIQLIRPCRRWSFWIWYPNPDDLAIWSEAFPAVSADIGYITSHLFAYHFKINIVLLAFAIIASSKSQQF